MKVLINDGMHQSGITMLRENGFEVQTEKIPQEELDSAIENFDVICVRSATKVREATIDKASKLKIIGRGGVGLDNIDVDYAKSKGIAVMNTPAASTRSVAELALAHIFSLSRHVSEMNRQMPKRGAEDFKKLKKQASSGTELMGKTLGLIGFGRIGKETAQLALGCGMKIIAYDPFVKQQDLSVSLHQNYSTNFNINVKTQSMDEVLAEADFISLHIPGGQGYVLDRDHLAKMKDGAGLINCARGGTVNEEAMNDFIKSGKIKYAGIDVFEKEPPVFTDFFGFPNVSLTPHIGAATAEAQERVGTELASKIIEHFK